MMDKRGKITLSVIIVSILLISFSLYFVLATRENWVINGNKVYIDDSNVYISAEPHTIYESGYVYFNVISKVYNGNVDLVFGFDTDKLRPIKAEIYEPYNVTYSNEICTHNNQTNETSCNIISYTQLEEWKDISDSFNSINYDYGNMNKWFYLRNVPVQANKNYKFGVLIEVQRGNGFSPAKVDSKYWFAIKPSSETLSQSISNNHLYALDPWINSTGQDQNKDYLDDELIAYWNFDIDGNDSTEYNSYCTGDATHYDTGGIIDGYYNFTGSNVLTCMNNSVLRVRQNLTYAVWSKMAPANDGQIIDMPLQNADVGNNFVWAIYYDGTNYDSYINTDVTAAGMTAAKSGTGFANNWLLWVVTYNGTSFCNYVNGTLHECKAITGFLDQEFVGAPNLSIGKYVSTTSPQYWDGGIDEIGVWNRSLNSSEAEDLWNNGIGITYSPIAPDTIAPIWKYNWTSATDQTKKGDLVYFNITLEDNVAGGYYVFSFDDGTGSFVNDSPASWITPQEIEIIRTITAIKNQEVRWKWYFNNSIGNNNKTPIWSFTVANSPPNQSQPLLSTLSGKNFSYENLTCYNQSTDDADNDAVTNIYNWYKNSQSLTVLNLPFESNANDYSGNNNDGTNYGASFIEGKVGKALSFNGIDDYVEIPDSNSLDIIGNLTLETWIYPKDIAGSHTFIVKGGENWNYVNYLLRTSGDEIEFKWYNSGFETHKTTDVNLVVNNWYHIIAIHDASNNIAKIYVNGDEKLSESTIKTKLADTRSLSIGIDRDINGNLILPFNGTIDEIKIYPYALTSEQIKQIYEETKDGLTSSSTIVSQETTVGDNYMCQVTPNDAEEDGTTLNSSTAEIKWAITFDVRDSYSNINLNGVSIGCNYSGFNQAPYTTNPYGPYEFPPGNWQCNFSVTDYFSKIITFTANEDKTVTILMSREKALTPEEHTWLEAIYNCLYLGDCSLYNLLLEMNQTIGKIWEHTKPTDESVIAFENVTNKVVNSTNNLTIDYNVNIPIKAGYSLGAYLPVRIGYWFLNEDNTTCYNQGDKPTGVEEPYCQPLIIETIGPMGGQVNFTVKLQPSLPAGNYSIKRIIDIDPNNVWINYGQELISTFTMAESLTNYGISIEKTGETKAQKERELLQDVKSTITGAVTGVGQLLSGWQIVAIIAIIGGVLIVFIISKTILQLKKK